MRPYFWRTALPLAALLVLNGCATTPGKPGATTTTSAHLESAWKRHADNVNQIRDGWTCVGRAAIREGGRGGTVDVNWHQLGPMFHVRLSAPLDQGVVDMSGNMHSMLIADGQGHRQLTAEPEKTLKRLTGWELPMAALPDWIIGLPHNQPDQRKLDQHGRLSQMIENGWHIRYDRYRYIDKRVFLPGLIVLTKNDLHVKLLIRKWSLHANQQ